MTHSVLKEFFNKRQLGVKLGLETMHALAESVGNPQNKLNFIHIAGTNGKGSTAVMLEAILRYSGFKVGLFTSPHLMSFCERIQIDRQPLSEKVLMRLYKGLQPILSEVERQSNCHSPTFFEITTALALLAFYEEKVDWVVWETGMGGRLDSTNIVQPKLSVITPISFDHQAWLGSTLEAIAHEKAGIIKPNTPIISAPQFEVCAQVISKQALEKKAPYFRIKEDKILLENENLEGQKFSYEKTSYFLNLLGEHQRQNAATVLEIVYGLRRSGIKISEEAIKSGFKTVTWPARFQILQRNPLVILDGAHNAAGIEVLVKNYHALCGETKTNLLFGVLSDKEFPSMILHLLPLIKKVVLIPLTSSRAVKPDVLASYFRDQGTEIEIFSNFKNAWCALKSESLLITGSLYLAGEVLSFFVGFHN